MRAPSALTLHRTSNPGFREDLVKDNVGSQQKQKTPQCNRGSAFKPVAVVGRFGRRRKNLAAEHKRISSAISIDISCLQDRRKP
jgi:hypothetical protein